MLSRPARFGLAATIVLLAGCGADRPTPALHRTIGVRLDEYRIVPEAITAPAGRLRIIARNRGRLTHNVKVQTIPSDPEQQPDVLGGTDTLQPGERDEKSIVLRPGRYELVCTIGNHDDLGQFGTLTVR